MVAELPSQVAFIFANKLYLFICYSIVFIVMDTDIRIGLLLMLILLYGHANFLLVVS
jgi:hypothetical protein